MHSILCPIIFIDGLDITLYRSVRAAESDLEPWIASDTSVKLTDGTGRALKVGTDGRVVRLETIEQESVDDSEIRRLLREALAATGRPVGSDLTLPELIERGYDAGFGYP